MSIGIYRIYDTCGRCFYQWSFPTWSQAFEFCQAKGRPDWKIRKQTY